MHDGRGAVVEGGTKDDGGDQGPRGRTDGGGVRVTAVARAVAMGAECSMLGGAEEPVKVLRRRWGRRRWWEGRFAAGVACLSERGKPMVVRGDCRSGGEEGRGRGRGRRGGREKGGRWRPERRRWRKPAGKADDGTQTRPRCATLMVAQAINLLLSIVHRDLASFT